MSRDELNRRRILLAIPALAGGFALSGCSAFLDGLGTSSHAGRRTVDSPVRPLVFSPAVGLVAVNATRRKYGLPAFRSDRRLQSAAQRHADLMARTGNYGHEFGPGTKFPTRLQAVGFDGSAGENLGVGYGSVEDAIDGWLKSPKHRTILLRRNYDLGGIAYAFNRSGRNPRYTHYWVLIVGADTGGGRYVLRT